MRTDDVWAVLLALAAAFAYAAGAVLQQRAAFPENSEHTHEHELTTEGALPLTAMLRQPVWLAGIVMDGAGFGLEFLALRQGSVTLVGPLLVTGLLFALPLAAVMTRRAIRTRDLAAGVLVCVSLAAFVAAARPSAGTLHASGTAWFATLAGATVAVLALLIAAKHRHLGVRATCIAAAAGLVNGVFAGLSKGMGDQLDQGWVALASSWLPWAFAVSAALSLTLAARAFQVGSPVAALTALFATEPLAGITVGALVFNEGIRHSLGALAMELGALAGCLAGVALLARSPLIIATYAHD
ncbi:MAG: DMT family transporter [Jatrophihabitantaceae bacterium]